MTSKPRTPGEEQPTQAPQQQQMQDSGSPSGANFGNIQPVEGEDPPEGNEVGGG
ncbi:MAG: hypothetical protein QOJ53_1053 [Sphingomonadales bacterium]|jgi:hypothetical protein|nr:hypothetical protein [Sphingomonadales bacterium]MEA3045467.1 hypothetical protein [Sphingomonadales bacterium]MEA3046721.1 hypothetical protein [Sphingomonadales bacterium]